MGDALLRPLDEGVTAPDAPGLDPDAVAARFARYGPNELPAAPRRSPWMRAVTLLVEPMAILLLVAAGVAGLVLGDRLEALAIVAIVIINALIGSLQEQKAERALAALRALETPTARVRRGGTVAPIPARELVPGDLVLIAGGDRIPADLRILRADALEVDESILTGESLPVPKRIGGPPEADLLYAGTMATRGTAIAETIGTGASTQLGAIAGSLSSPAPATPLQRQLSTLTAQLGGAAIAIAGGVFGLMVLRLRGTADGLHEAFLTAVALAVAAVPEGMAAVITLALALGVRQMARRGAVVRRLPAVETLGSTTVILTDKTGTLTEGRLHVEALAVDGSEVTPAEVSPDARRAIAVIARGCNDATLDPPSGDPLEIALLEAFPDQASPARAASIPFDAERRRMTVIARADGGAIALTKGAPETIVDRCVSLRTMDGRIVPMDEPARARTLAAADAMAARGMRVLAFASRALDDPDPDPARAEEDLVLAGLIGFRDRIRPAAADTIARARGAGVRVVMVTGDHARTAAAIASEIGLMGADGEVRTGEDLRRDGIPEEPASIPVYARVDPHQKLALVEALQARGDVLAVTGDGVNDAPALRRADIGVAMGESGSDVAREAADLVVTDDDLATVVAAIRAGRGIYDNIRKVVDYLVAGNLSEIAVVLGALLLFPALGVPLFPLQLLWINLMTDGLPALALSVDPVDPALMGTPPRRRDVRMLDRATLRLLGTRAALIAGTTLGTAAIVRFAWDGSWASARTTMFTVLVGAHLLYALIARTSRRPGARRIPLNPSLVGAIGVGIALQAATILLPAAHDLFDTTGLPARAWGLIAIGSVAPVAAMAVGRRLRAR